MMGGEHYKTVFGDGRIMGSDEAAHAGNLRDAAEQERRQVMAMGDHWQDGSWDEAMQTSEHDFRVNNDQADVHNNVSSAIHNAVDTGEDALQRVRGIMRMR